MHLGQNIVEKILEVSAKYSQKNAFGAQCNGENLEVLAKYIHKKCILGKIEWRKTPFGVRYNGDKFENLGKIERFFWGEID